MRMATSIWELVDPWNLHERLRHQAVEEVAYFRWLRRGQPPGDPWADWFAAETEVITGWPVPNYLDSFVRWHHQATEVTAYFRWLGRGQPPGDPLAEWFAAETEVYDLALRWFNWSMSWLSGWMTWPQPV